MVEQGVFASPIAALGAAVALLGLSNGALAQGMAVKIGIGTIQDPQHQISDILAERLNKGSGGKLAARVYPAGQLGKIARMIEGIQLGTQEILIAPPGFLVGHNAAFQVPDAPGVFKDVWHAHRALNDPAFREPYSKLALGTGIRVLALYVYGPTSFATLRPIRKLADFKGKKIRVLATKMESELVGKMGATGVPMPYIEVLPGLSRKTVDGVRSSIIVMGGSKFFTVTKYITVVESGQIPSAIFASESWLKKLPSDLRKLVVDTTSGMGRGVHADRSRIRCTGREALEGQWRRSDSPLGGRPGRVHEQSSPARRQVPRGAQQRTSPKDVRHPEGVHQEE